jgi:hypothetical protein
MAASSDSSSSEKLMDSQVQKNTAADDEPAGTPAEPPTTETIKKKKKKILIQVDQWYVNEVLSYDPKDITVPYVPDYCFKSDPKLAAQLYMMMADMALYEEHTRDKKLEEQRNFRHQLRTQGRVTYEIEVDEDNPWYKDEASGGGSAGGRGRRRRRPGIVKKQDGHTRKLN